jgi:hypothetical protein
MCLQKVINITLRKQYYLLLASWSSLTKLVGSGSGSVPKFHGYATLTTKNNSTENVPYRYTGLVLISKNIFSSGSESEPFFYLKICIDHATFYFKRSNSWLIKGAIVFQSGPICRWVQKDFFIKARNNFEDLLQPYYVHLKLFGLVLIL